MALDIIQDDEDPEAQNVEEYQKRNDWPKMEKCYTGKIILINKMRSFLTCSSNALKYKV